MTIRLVFVQRLVLIAALVWVLSLSFLMWLWAFRHGMAFSDFTVFWTAARFDRVYDPAAFTAAQAWLLPSGVGPRPFVYPPTALFFFKLLSPFPYGAGLAVWLTVSLVLFFGAARLYGNGATCAALSLAVQAAIMGGQVALILGAAFAAAVAMLERRPIAAGMLFGIVAAIKPQLAILVPVGLVFAGNWTALKASAITALSVSAASLSLDPHLWREWLLSLPSFASQVSASGYDGLRISTGLWFAPLGVVSVAYVFRRSTDASLRLLALVSGACLCSPYMMLYDLSALMPAGATLAFDRRPSRWLLGAAMFFSSWVAAFSAIGAVLVLLDDRKRLKDGAHIVSIRHGSDPDLVDRCDVGRDRFGHDSRPGYPVGTH